MEKPGGEVENGFMGEEEELCRTCPDFYNALKEYHQGKNPIELLGKIVYTNPNPVKQPTTLSTDENVIIQQINDFIAYVTYIQNMYFKNDILDVNFIRNDGCDDTEAYIKFTNNIEARVLSMFIPNLKTITLNDKLDKIIDTTTSMSKTTIMKFFNDDFKTNFTELLKFPKDKKTVDKSVKEIFDEFFKKCSDSIKTINTGNVGTTLQNLGQLFTTLINK